MEGPKEGSSHDKQDPQRLLALSDKGNRQWSRDQWSLFFRATNRVIDTESAIHSNENGSTLSSKDAIHQVIGQLPAGMWRPGQRYLRQEYNRYCRIERRDSSSFDTIVRQESKFVKISAPVLSESVADAAEDNGGVGVYGIHWS